MDKQKLIESLRKVGAHIGYSSSRRHPSTRPFIYASKIGKDIINLESSVDQIEKAINFLKPLIENKKQILFVGVKPEAKEKIKNTGIALSMPYTSERFIGGTLTNFPEIKRRIEKLIKRTEEKQKGELAIYTKKEQMLIAKDIERMTRNFGGLLTMTGLPSAVVIVDPKQEEIAFTEAKQMRIPVVALCNTDCNIKSIDYPIVVNDASSSTIETVLNTLVKSIEN